MSTSPRSTVLGRSSAMKRGRSDTFGLHRSDMFTLPHSLEENLLSVLVLAAVVVAAVVAYVVGDHYAAVAAQQSWQEVFQNPVLAGVALLAVLVCTAWVTAHAYMHSDHFARWVLLAIFVVAAVVLSVALWLFFRRHDDRTIAFYLVVLAVVGLVVHTWFCWRALRVMGLVGMLPAILLGVFLLYHFWPDNVSSSAKRA